MAAQSESTNDSSKDAQVEPFEKYRAYLHVIAHANLGTVLKRKVDASDVVQQTLMQAYAKREQFQQSTDDEGAVRGWLKTILRNRLIDFARKWKGEKRDARREVAMEKSIDESIRRVDDWLAVSYTSPSQNMVQQEQLHRLPEALEQLPDDLRETIVMHHLQGLKLREIADRMDCDETTVGRRLVRGLRQLQNAMQD